MESKALEVLVVTVRRKSRAGDLVPLEECCPGGAEEFAVLAAGTAAIADIHIIHEGGRAWLFSDCHMTRRYAEAAALGSSGDTLRTIAATVRADSAIYPRPTPAEIFCSRPYSLTMEAVIAAVGRMRTDVQYDDVRPTRASNGELFLFSARHLNPEQAESMAEWIAVGRSENP